MKDKTPNLAQGRLTVPAGNGKNTYGFSRLGITSDATEANKPPADATTPTPACHGEAERSQAPARTAGSSVARPPGSRRPSRLKTVVDVSQLPPTMPVVVLPPERETAHAPTELPLPTTLELPADRPTYDKSRLAPARSTISPMPSVRADVRELREVRPAGATAFGRRGLSFSQRRTLWIGGGVAFGLLVGGLALALRSGATHTPDLAAAAAQDAVAGTPPRLVITSQEETPARAANAAAPAPPAATAHEFIPAPTKAMPPVPTPADPDEPLPPAAITGDGPGVAVTPAPAPTTQPKPTSAPAVALASAFRAAPPDYSLSFTMRGPRGWTGVINNRSVSVGDTVNDARVVAINEFSAELELDGQRFMLSITAKAAPAPFDEDATEADKPDREKPAPKIEKPADKPASQPAKTTKSSSSGNKKTFKNS